MEKKELVGLKIPRKQRIIRYTTKHRLAYGICLSDFWDANTHESNEQNGGVTYE